MGPGQYTTGVDYWASCLVWLLIIPDSVRATPTRRVTDRPRAGGEDGEEGG